MSAPFNRSFLTRGPAIVTYAGATLFTRGDIVPRHAPGWEDVVTSMYGRVDRAKKDLVLKIGLPLFGNWTNLSVLFPSYCLNPITGTSVFVGWWMQPASTERLSEYSETPSTDRASDRGDSARSATTWGHTRKWVSRAWV